MTKTGAFLHSIAVTLIRTGGTVSAAIIKTEPSANPISITLVRTGGTVLAAVAKGTADVHAVSVGVTRTGGTVTAAVTRGIAAIVHPITATLTRTGGTVTAAVRSLTAASVTGTIVVQTTSKGYMSFNVERQPGTNQVILENVPEVNDIPDNAVFIARTAIQPTTWRVLSVRETAKNEFQVGALEHNPSKYDFIEEGLELEEDVTSVFPTGALAPPISLVASEVEYTEMGGAFIRLTLSIEAPIDPRIVGYAIETIAPSGVVGLLGPSRELTYEIENATAGDWEFKAFSLDAQGSRSVATAIEYTVVGATFPAGADGVGVEYIFTVYSDETLPTNRWPRNVWGYDEPGTRNGQIWTDEAQNGTPTNPYLFRSERDAIGQPEVGDDVPDSWSEPKIVGHFGVDGVAFEYVYTAYSDETLPTNRQPLNTWGYDDPGTVNGQTWADGAPSLTLTNSFLFLSQRRIVGAPVMGADVTDDWSIPVVIGRYGQEGQAGLDGDDGVGIEYIFTAYSAETLPTNRRPLNTWGYDDPATRNGQTWTDGAPDTTSTTPFLFRSERDIVGTPTLGDAVPDTWSEPKIVGHFGMTGEDGGGVEIVFARSALNLLPQSQHPDEGWGYRTPGVRGDLQWYIEAPEKTGPTPHIHWSRREAPGDPEIGSEITDGWSVPEVLSGDSGAGILNIERDSATGIITVTFTDGRTQLFSVSDGRDGKTLERIFIRTQELIPPSIPVSESATDDYVPDGFTDNAIGTDGTWRFEWEFLRRGELGNWGDFEGPYLRNDKYRALEGATEWRLGEDYIEGQRVFILAVIRSGLNSISVPSYYVSLSTHTSTNDDKPPNATFWQSGDGSINIPSDLRWVIFNGRAVLLWTRSALTGTYSFIDQGDLPISRTIQAATYHDGNFYAIQAAISIGRLQRLPDPEDPSGVDWTGSFTHDDAVTIAACVHDGVGILTFSTNISNELAGVYRLTGLGETSVVVTYIGNQNVSGQGTTFFQAGGGMCFPRQHLFSGSGMGVKYKCGNRTAIDSV